jgi:hypothetical protein
MWCLPLRHSLDVFRSTRRFWARNTDAIPMNSRNAFVFVSHLCIVMFFKSISYFLFHSKGCASVRMFRYGTFNMACHNDLFFFFPGFCFISVQAVLACMWVLCIINIFSFLRFIAVRSDLGLVEYTITVCFPLSSLCVLIYFHSELLRLTFLSRSRTWRYTVIMCDLWKAQKVGKRRWWICLSVNRILVTIFVCYMISACCLVQGGSNMTGTVYTVV